MNDIYDVVVIGAGPAGMSASLYASRANKKTLMIEKECPGGKLLKTKKIENYLGGVSQDGISLASSMFKQSISFNALYKQGNVVSIKNDDIKEVILSDGEIIKCYSIILACGGKLSDSNFKYDKYLNKGLSYCVVCDASFYKGNEVCLIGDDTSFDELEYLSNIASHVYFINKDKGMSNKKNVTTFNTSEYELYGDDFIQGIRVSDNDYKISGAFYVLESNNFNGFVKELDTSNGYINVDNNMHTSINGIYACGDIVNKNIKQVISACGDGALAALEAIKYVNKIKNI